MRCILLDIEGTTTPISFVHDTLFPYARERMESFAEEHWEQVEPLADLFRNQAARDLADERTDACPIPDGPVEEVRATLLRNALAQMDAGARRLP